MGATLLKYGIPAFLHSNEGFQMNKQTPHFGLRALGVNAQYSYGKNTYIGEYPSCQKESEHFIAV